MGQVLGTSGTMMKYKLITIKKDDLLAQVKCPLCKRVTTLANNTSPKHLLNCSNKSKIALV